MADTRLTKIPILRAIKFCLFGTFRPMLLIKAELADEEVRKKFPQPQPPEEPRAFKVARALWVSLIWVIASIALGYALGMAFNAVLQEPRALLAKVLQVIGAMLLLWGTLFVRGWDIQSWSGVTLSEKVNRWLFRFLYCLGTAIIVTSLAL